MNFMSPATPSPKRQFALDQIKQAMSGEGKHIFRNKTNKEIVLPKPAMNGRSNFDPGECFLGDSYFFQMLNQLEHVQTLDNPSVIVNPEPPKMLNESCTASDDVLITETPPVVSKNIAESAKVKKPVRKTGKNVNEYLTGSEDQLILEDPVGSIEILINE